MLDEYIYIGVFFCGSVKLATSFVSKHIILYSCASACIVFHRLVIIIVSRLELSLRIILNIF